MKLKNMNLPLYWRVSLILTLFLSLVGMNYSNARANNSTYYVDNTNIGCSDVGPGTTTNLPFCTISKGASMAIAGDVVRVLAGTYAETITAPNSGSADLPITFAAAPGVKVLGKGKSASNGFLISNKSYITVDGFTITGTSAEGIYVAGSNHITVSNNIVSYSGQPKTGSTKEGIHFSNTNNSAIQGNTTYYNTQDGIRLDYGCFNITVSDNVSFGNAEQTKRNATGIGLHLSYSNTIIHNITYANEDTGLNFFESSHDNKIIDNLTYGNGDHGIDNNGSAGNIIIGNTVHGNYTAGINVEGTSPNTTIANNIIVDNGINPSSGQKSNLRVEASSVSGTTIDYDLFSLSSGTVQIQWNGVSYSTLSAFKTAVAMQEVHGLQANPFFKAPAPVAVRPVSAPYNVAVNRGDYHITAGSPAIDSANSNAIYESNLDIEHSPRADDSNTPNTGAGIRDYDDRGAYEFQSTVTALTETSTLVPTYTLLPPTGTSTPIPTYTPLSPTLTYTPPFTSTSTTVPASALTFVANADAYVRSASPNTNYGTGVSLWVDGGTAFYESYLKFTVSGMTGNIQKAVLRIYATSSTVNTTAVYGADNAWTETGITWNNRPTRIGGAIESKGPIATNTWLEYDVTIFVTGDGIYTFDVAMNNPDAISFSSREGSQLPQLVLTIAP
jgi:parallel beta-helix repeat protein